MRHWILLSLFLLSLLSACDFFDTTTIQNNADNERKLKDLQWALLIPAESPPATPVIDHATTGNLDPAASHEPANSVPSTNETVPAEGHGSGGHGETAAAEQAGAMHPAETEHANPDAEHSEGAAAVEHDESKAVPTTLAVLAVVDAFTLLPVSEDVDPVEHAKQLDLAQRRERVVRQELQNVLVDNTMITVVQPNTEQIAQARDEIGSTNSAALSNTMLPGLAETLGVQHVITALIDLEGHEVNIVAQHAPDGTIVFQDTLVDWEPVMAVAKGGVAEEAETAQ